MIPEARISPRGQLRLGERDRRRHGELDPVSRARRDDGVAVEDRHALSVPAGQEPAAERRRSVQAHARGAADETRDQARDVAAVPRVRRPVEARRDRHLHALS